MTQTALDLLTEDPHGRKLIDALRTAQDSETRYKIRTAMQTYVCQLERYEAAREEGLA